MYLPCAPHQVKAAVRAGDDRSNTTFRGHHIPTCEFVSYAGRRVVGLSEHDVEIDAFVFPWNMLCDVMCCYRC